MLPNSSANTSPPLLVYLSHWRFKEGTLPRKSKLNSPSARTLLCCAPPFLFSVVSVNKLVRTSEISRVEVEIILVPAHDATVIESTGRRGTFSCQLINKGDTKTQSGFAMVQAIR